MTDRIFQGGTTDWFTGSSWLPEGTPIPGDIMTITSGDGTISAADVETFGTLDGEQLLIGSDSAAAPAEFSTDGATFGPAFVIDSIPGGYANLNFSGSVTYAGVIDLATAGGAMSLDIAADDTGSSVLHLTGTLSVENGDSLAIDGGTLALDGTVDIDGGTLDVGGDTRVSGDGTINISAGGTLVLDGFVDRNLTINFTDGTGTLDIVDPLDFHASVTGFVTGDVLDLINTPADNWSYGTTVNPTLLTVYSGNSKTNPNPQVASFNLTSSAPLTTAQIYVGSDDDGGDLDALPAQLPPDLAHAIDPEILLPDPADLHPQHGITSCARWQAIRIAPPGRIVMIGGRGDRQNAANRLDPMGIPVIVDEGDHFLNGRSSSAAAK